MIHKSELLHCRSVVTDKQQWLRWQW